MDFAAAIEKTRRDLLELSARNRLVHTPLEGKRNGWIAIEDEKSDQLFDVLVRQRKTMTFLPSASPAEDDERQRFLRAFDAGTKVSEAAESFTATPPAAEDATPPAGESHSDGTDRTSREADASGEVDASRGIDASRTVASPDDADGELDVSADAADATAERQNDLFLQTPLSKEKLEDRLLRCFYDAKTAEEEQGSSILFLACGFLKWRETGTSDVYRYAPLLLFPVDLSRNTARSKFRLRFRDDEIVTNLSIQARLRQDFGLRLPDLPENLQDDEAWSPSNYFEQVRELIKGREGWEVMADEVLLWFFSFTKFLMFRDLSPEAWPQDRPLTANRLVAGLLGGGFGSELSLPPVCGEDEPIDAVLSPADVVHVTDADSSQAVAVAEIAAGRDLVVQGPPGTGKSQTITNAIAAAVHAGKRVLFVSEKMAALEVVKRRLDAMGLGPMTLELHSHKAQKREVLADLKATLELGTPTGTKHVPIDELRGAAVRLRRHDEVLHAPVGRSGVSPYQAMGQLMRLRGEGHQPPKKLFAAISDWTLEEYRVAATVASELDRLLKDCGVPASNPWFGVRCAAVSPAEHQRLGERIARTREGIAKLQAANEELAKVLGLPAATNLLDASQQAVLASHLKQLPAATDRPALADARWDGEVVRLESALKAVAELRAARSIAAERVADAAWDVNWTAARVAMAAYGKSWLRFLNGSFRRASATLRGVAAGPLPPNADDRLALVDALIRGQKALKRLEADRDFAASLLGKLWSGEDTTVDEAEKVVSWVKDSLKSEHLKQHARKIAATMDDPRAVAGPLANIAQTLKAVDAELAEIVKALELDLPEAFGQTQPRTVPLAAWQDRLAAWLQAPEQLSHYVAANARLEKLRSLGFEDLASEVRGGELRSGGVLGRLEWVRAEAVLDRAWRERPELAEFHGESFEQLRARFAELDQQRIALSRFEVVKAHHGNLPAASADGGQVSVIRREINKKRCHMPIRRLLKEAGQAVQRIKPVFMMSPLSVAQFLEPGGIEFDLLVIDEASQVQPVDALGAIARCKQIVVVGDQRQLPPTDFFGRMAGEERDDDEEGASAAGDMESILGLCEAQGLTSRMLRWHYRSQHESLIAVSNRQFYSDRLFIVPSPVASGGPLGLKLRHVAGGWYDRGGSRANRNEAIAVADAVMEHARNRPEMSLGVATFSAAQRNAILDELELRRKADPSTEDFFNAGGSEPFFVKSLENVQGDQRDVIYISIGYARDQNGYFAQNFGPLNRKGGERRLNVLISRAASACEVFTSIKADDIDLSRTHSEGVAALKMYLNYAEHGRLDAPRPCGDADSPFEEQVAKALRTRGLEVDHQIGVAGFFIDLAVRDLNRPGRYLLGIECDGAQYHAARWVRDRDRLRQAVLESRGWAIHRIWSTDWFQRPEEQLAKVLAAVDAAKQYWEDADRAEAEDAAVVRPRAVEPDSEEPVWERTEVLESSDEADRSTEYREASFSVGGFTGGTGELKIDQVAMLMKRIAEIESPIHIDEVGRRCISLLGRGKLVASFKTKLAAAADRLQGQGVLERRGDFVYRAGQNVFPPRNRRELSNAGLRRIESIAPEELRAAIMTVIVEHIGPDEAEIAASVSRIFGIQNTRSVQEAVRDAVAQLAAAQAVEQRGGKLFIG